MAPPTTPREEALLYLEWLRGAAGRFAPGEDSPRAAPEVSPRARPPAASRDAVPCTPRGARRRAPAGGTRTFGQNTARRYPAQSVMGTRAPLRPLKRGSPCQRAPSSTYGNPRQTRMPEPTDAAAAGTQAASV